MSPEMKKKLVELQARASLASIAIPSPFGDVVGLGADALGYAVDPAQRTPLNFGLSAAGLLPFVPASSLLRRATDATQKARPELFDDEAAEVAKRALDGPTSAAGRAVAATINPEEQFALARAVNKGNPKAAQVPPPKEKIGGFTSRGVPESDPRYALFTKMADTQRGHPEIAMRAAQEALHLPQYSKAKGNGVMGYLLEHVGDLTHRIGEKGGAFGEEFVKGKVESALRILSNPHDVDNLWEFPRMPELAKYQLAHQKVPVYNELQDAAKQAAIAIADRNPSVARKHLLKLKDAIDNGQWDDIYKLDPTYEALWKD